LSSEGIRRNSACVANLTRFFDWLPVCHAQVVVEGLARLFRQLEPDWAAGFLRIPTIADSNPIERGQ